LQQDASGEWKQACDAVYLNEPILTDS